MSAFARLLADDTPDLTPGNVTKNVTEAFHEAELVEEHHIFDAQAALLWNVTIMGCLLLAYFVKRFRIYYLPGRYVE
jgi:hypothetical protein